MSEPMLFSLPWPSPKLSPNARLHWAAKSRATKAYRQLCWFEASSSFALWKRQIDPAARLRVSLQFCPPDRRERDMDNLVASIKSGLDGLADALGVNDRRFQLAEPVFGSVVKGGGVFVRIEELLP